MDTLKRFDWAARKAKENDRQNRDAVQRVTLPVRTRTRETATGEPSVASGDSSLHKGATGGGDGAPRSSRPTETGTTMTGTERARHGMQALPMDQGKSKQVRVDSLEKQRDAIQKSINATQSAGAASFTTNSRSGADAHTAYIRRLQKQVEDLDREIGAGKDEIWQIGQDAERGRYEAVAGADDFAAGVSAGRAADLTPKLDLPTLGQAFGGDLSGREIVERVVKPRTAGDYTDPSDEDMDDDAKRQNLGYLTQDERDVILYYAGKGDFKSVQRYYKLLERTLDERRQGMVSEGVRSFSKEHPAIGTAYNLGSSLAVPGAFVGNAVQTAKNALTGAYEPTNTNSAWFAGAHGVNDSQEGVTGAAREAAAKTFQSEKAGDAAAGLAGIGLSIGQSAATLPLGPAGSLAMAGGRAAGTATLDALERGATPGQALGYSAAVGAVEAATEKLPIDNLFRLARTAPEGAKQVILQVVKQMGSEATQEAVSEVADNAIDQMVMGDKSQFDRYVSELVSTGVSREAAQSRAFKQFYLSNVGQAAVGGAVSGGVMGGGAQILGAVRGRSGTGTTTETGDGGWRAESSRPTDDGTMDAGGSGTLPYGDGTGESVAQTTGTLPTGQKNPASTGETVRTSAPETSAGKPATEIDVHIDDRTLEDVGQRRVKAFQFDHPELHEHFADAARSLLYDLDGTTKGERFPLKDRDGYITGYTGVTRSTSAPLEMALDDVGLSYQQVRTALENIIADHGQENYAAAKRVELILDNVLTDGYTDIDGNAFEPDAAYIAAKGRLKAGQAPESTDYRKSEEEWASLLHQEEPVGPESSVGAAAEGFDPYSHMQNKFGTIPAGEKPFRVADVPRSTTGEDKVSRTARTVLEAEATPKDRVGTVAQAVVDGKLSYIPTANAEVTAKARKTIETKGWDAALKDYTADVRAGKHSAELTALGATLLNNAGNSGMDGKAYVDLLTDYAANVRGSAQATQAARILKRLSPEGTLYAIQRMVDDLNETPKKPGPKAPKPQDPRPRSPLPRTPGQPLPDGQSRGKGRTGRRDANNIPVDEWMRRTGEELAGKLETAVKAPKEKVNTTVDIILDDLYRYAKEHVDTPTPEKTTRTNMDRIQDLFDNYGNYQEAWDAAKAKVEKDLGGDGRALRVFNEWMDSALDYGGALTKEVTGQDEIKIDPALADRFLAAKDEKARNAALDDIYQNVADQVPATFADKWNAWRYLSMLGNPRTHVRNIVGNAAFAPVRGVKNAAAYFMEHALLPSERRTKGAVSRLTAEGRALLKAGYADIANVEGELLGEGKFGSSVSGEINKRKTVFKTKPLEALRRANGAAMDVEDTWFSKPAYAGALAGYLKAHGVTAEAFNAWTNADSGRGETPQSATGGQLPSIGEPRMDVVDGARAYAIREAQKATYRDANVLSDFVSKLKVKGDNSMSKGANFVIEGILPFKRTPANILARGLEYSPAGLVKGLTADLVQVRRGKLTAAQAIDDIAAGLTGTALTALGAFLAHAGTVTGGGSGDEREDGQDDLEGKQPYALSIGGKNYTLDWLAPEAMPFFVGVEIAGTMEDRSEDGVDLNAVLSGMERITDPMLEMSMLQGVQDALDTVKYADGGTLIKVVANAAVSHLTQAVPTLFGQIERTGETERGSTFIDKKSPLPGDMQYTLGKVMNKLPGEFQQIPYIDAWGRHEESGSLPERAMGNFLSPAYSSTETVTAADKELRRLHDRGQDGVFPQRVSQSVKVDGDTLSRDEYVEYAETVGSTSYDMVDALIKTASYRSLSDEGKANAVALCYQYSKAVAGKKVAGADVEPYVVHAQNAKKELGVSTAEYLALCERYGKSNLSAENTREAHEAGMDVKDYLDYRAIDKDTDDSDGVSLKERAAAIGKVKDADQRAILWGIEEPEWPEAARKAGVPINTYAQYKVVTSGLAADKDKNGKSVSGSKKAKVLSAINAMSVSRQQKDALYLAAGYTQKTIGEAPWR